LTGSALAAECQQHRGLHLFEDLSIVEVVDESNQPVPPGTFGAKVLLTVLWSRTQPLIRYELGDSLRLSADPCSDGRLTRVIEAILGRTEDTLHLPGVAGTNVAILPNVIHNVLDGAPVGGWQVVQESDHLRVLVAEPQPGFEAAALGERLHRGLVAQGALSTPVLVEQVLAIPRTPNGKAPLIRALRG
jgi:phenylacetate-CoA ligase